MLLGLPVGKICFKADRFATVAGGLPVAGCNALTGKEIQRLVAAQA